MKSLPEWKSSQKSNSPLKQIQSDALAVGPAPLLSANRRVRSTAKQLNFASSS